MHIETPAEKKDRALTPLHMEQVFSSFLKEKITSVDAYRSVFGGFEGGVYAIEKDELGAEATQVHSHNAPISFLMCGYNLVLGDWTGACILDKQTVHVSMQPIKYIHPGRDFCVASDASSLFLVVDTTVMSQLHLGTYVLRIMECGDMLVCITGYSVHWITVANTMLQSVATYNIQEATGTTETITCITGDATRFFCGTIGGWIIELSGYEVPGECTVRKIHKVAAEKLTDLLLYVHKKEQFFLCTTPNTLFLVQRKPMRTAGYLQLTRCNGLCSVWKLSAGMLAVLNINHAIYTVVITEHLEEPAALPASPVGEPEKTPEEIYNELFLDISSGRI